MASKPFQQGTVEQQNEALNKGVVAPGLTALEYNTDPNVSARQRAIRQRIDAIKNSAEGQAMQAFIVSNLNGQQSQGARDQIRHYYQTIDNVALPDGTQTQEKLPWQAFKEIATETLNNNGNQETFNQFVERVSYQAPVRGTIENEPEAQQPEEVEVQPTGNEADQYAERYLQGAQTAFFTSHAKWLEKHENARDAQGNPAAYSNQLFNAVEYALGGGKSRGGNKKWKELLARFYQKNPATLAAIQPFIEQTKGSIPKAIDAEILQAKANGQEPASVVALRQLIQSKDKETRKEIQEHILDSARILAAPREGKSNTISLNAPGGANGKDWINTLADENAVRPEDIEPSMSQTQLNTANTAWDNFIGNQQNAQTIQQIRGLRSGRGDAGEAMLPLLVKTMKRDEFDLIKEAIHTAFVGWNDAGLPKWQEFFNNNPQLAEGQKGEALLNKISQIAAGQSAGLEQLQQFVTNSAYNFLIKNFEERGLDLRDNLSSIAPGVGSLRTFQQVNNLVSRYLIRHYNYMKKREVNSGDEFGSAYKSARRYALMKAKGDAYVRMFKRLMESNEPIRLSQDAEIMRSPNSDTFVIRKREKLQGKNEYRMVENIIQDDDFDLLQGIVPNEQWVPRAIEMMRERFPQEKKIMKRDDGREVSPISEQMDAANAQYREAHPDEADRLKGFRLKMGEYIRYYREHYVKPDGEVGLTPDELAQIIVRPTGKKGRPSGARITKYPLEMINALEAGEATRYGRGDLEKLAEALGFTHEGRDNKIVGDYSKFYARPDEYDPFHVEDLTDLHSTVGQAFRVYGTYLLHRKKEAIRRGIRDDFFTQRMLHFYLSLMQVHNNFSTKPKNKNQESEKIIGKILYQLVGKPVGLKDVTMDDIKDNIGHLPTTDSNEPGGSIKDKVPDFRGPRTTTDFQTGEQSTLPPSLVHRYYYDENIANDPYDPEKGGNDPAFLSPEDQPKDPNDIRRKFYQPDPDQWLKAIQTIPFTEGKENSGPHDLDFYINRKINQLRQQAADSTPELFENQIDRMPSTTIARALLKKVWPERKVDDRWLAMDDATANHMLETKMQKANEYNQRHNIAVEGPDGQPLTNPDGSVAIKQYRTLEDFCDKYVKDELKTKRYFRNKAQADLQTLQEKMNGDILDKIRYFVPASVRHKALFMDSKKDQAVPLRPLLDPNQLDENGRPMEKFDASQALNILLAALEEMDHLGEMYKTASYFETPTRLGTMLEDMVQSAIDAILKLS